MHAQDTRTQFGQPVGPGLFTKAGVGVLILNDSNQVLLEKRSDCGFWGLPGGKIDPGESVEQAAVREVREETGLNVEIKELFGVYSDPATRVVRYPGGDLAQLIDIVLIARAVSGTLTLSEESEELAYFSLDQLPEEMVAPALIPVNDYRERISSGGENPRAILK